MRLSGGRVKNGLFTFGVLGRASNIVESDRRQLSPHICLIPHRQTRMRSPSKSGWFRCLCERICIYVFSYV